MKPASIELIKEDSRGSVSRITLPDKDQNHQISSIFTKAGVLRGGDQHKESIQYNVILSGEWEIWYNENGQDIRMKKKAGDFLAIPPGVPHLFVCVKDSWLLEWWNNPSEWVLKNDAGQYPRYKKIIERMANDPSYKPSLPEDFE